MTDRHIRIVTGMQGTREDAICFETGASASEVRDLGAFVFEHHGQDHHSLFSPSALRLFHERLMLGQAMPPLLLLTRWWRIDQLLAAALFIEPALLLHPATTSLVSSFDLVERLGSLALPHIAWEHKELLRLLRHRTAGRSTRATEQEEALALVVSCARDIIAWVVEGTLNVEPEIPPVLEALATGEGFLAFTSPQWAWDVAWSSGAVWGVWFGPKRTEVRLKSALVGLPHDVLEARLGPSFVYEDGSSPGWVLDRGLTEVEQQEVLERLVK
jgi:hypothetical protein